MASPGINQGNIQLLWLVLNNFLVLFVETKSWVSCRVSSVQRSSSTTDNQSLPSQVTFRVCPRAGQREEIKRNNKKNSSPMSSLPA